MSRTHNPEIPRKLIDALIRTVIEQGFGPGIDTITERAGVSKMTAYAQFTSRSGMTVAALERVGRSVRGNLDIAMNATDSERQAASTKIGRVIDSLLQQLSEREDPLGFITCCILGHPDPRSKIHLAAMCQHQAIMTRIEMFLGSIDLPQPHEMARAMMTILHGAHASMLACQSDERRVICDTKKMMVAILTTGQKEVAEVGHN